MGRSFDGADSDSNPTVQAETGEQPEHDVTVSAFCLDAVEVTVGRFRAFVDAYDEAGTLPEPGEGQHPHIPGSGWASEYDAELPAASAIYEALDCHDETTWTVGDMGNEAKPMNCVTWHLAFAFCIWDGGRLPTEAEWEKAAAGAEENRKYPWGPETPSDQYAIINHTLLQNVGSRPLGQGRFGQLDMIGGVAEWTLDAWAVDWYTYLSEGHECVDCANLNPTGLVAVRGGSFRVDQSAYLRSAYRGRQAPAVPDHLTGFRCARDL